MPLPSLAIQGDGLPSALADAARLTALDATGLLDAPAQPTLDRLTRLAGRLLGTPVALVSLVDARRQYLASCVGLDEATAGGREAPLSHSVCQHVVTTARPLVVEDAREHPVLRDSRAVSDFGLVAYAGMPLRTAEGHVLGSFCVIDGRPRAWSADDLATLEELARSATAEIELRTATRRLEERTAALEARSGELAQLLDVTTELVCACDAEGRITFVNGAWREALGYSAAEAAALRPADLVAPEHRTRYLETARRLVAGQTVDDFEAVLMARDGRRVVCRGRAVPIMADTPEGPRCVCTRAFFRDVTPEHEAEARRTRLLAMLEATSDFVGTAGPDGRIEFLNGAGRRMLGVEREADVHALSAPSFHPTETLALLEREALPTAARDGRWVGEGALLGPTGEHIPVSMVIVAHPSLVPGEPPYFSAVMRDLRDRMRAEAELRASEARFRAMFDGAAVGVTVVDDAGTLLHVNEAFAAFLGYARAELVGRHAPDFSPVEDAAVTRVPVAELRAGRQASVTVEKRFLRRDGEVRWAKLTISRLPLGDGTFGIVGVSSDVTERRRAQEALERERAFLRTVLDSLSENVSVCTPDGRLALFNRATLETHGLPADAAVTPERWSDHYHVYLPDGQTPFPPDQLPHVRVAATHADALGIEFVVRVPGRGPRTLVANAHVLRAPDGSYLGSVCAARDMTDQHAAERALAEQSARLALIYNSARDLMFLMRVERDERGAVTAYRCESVNAAYLEVTGIALEQLLGRTVTDFLPPAAAAAVLGRYADAVRTGEVQRYDEVVNVPTGRLTVETTLTPVRDDTGTCTYLLGVARDVSATRRAEAALRASEARFRGVLEQLRAPAVQVDAAGRVTFANEALLTLTGWTRAEALGADWFESFVPNAAIARLLFEESLRTGVVPVHHESELLTRGGAPRLVAWDHVGLRTPDDTLIGIASVGQDITERRALEARLAALSEHDELTGLLNRRGFNRMAQHAIKSAARSGRRDAVLYLDLDRLKPINDTYGHAAGDGALRAAADVVRATVRDADFGARLGGDEFAIFAVGLREGEGHVLAARLRANLDAHNAEATAAGRPFRVGFSVGVAELEVDDDLATLLARADAALYAQKLARHVPSAPDA